MADTPKPKRRHKTTPPPLSLREIRFCRHYAEHGDASAAYRAAGYPERPAPSTWVLASRVLRKVKVREYIRQIQDEACDVAGISVERIARALDRIGNADRRKLYDANGVLLPPHEWPDDIAAAVEGIETEELYEWVGEGDDRHKELVGYSRKVKIANRVNALKVLAQWKRMIGQDSQQQTGPPAPLVVGGEANPDAL